MGNSLQKNQRNGQTINISYEKSSLLILGTLFGGDTLLEEDTLLKAHCLLEATCLFEAKPLLEAKSIGFKVSGLLFGALCAQL